MANFKNYGNVEYWNERYSCRPEKFEWYQQYDGIKHLLVPRYLAPPIMNQEEPPLDDCERIHTSSENEYDDMVTKDQNVFPTKYQCRVLIIGCGNSNLGEEMMIDGWLGGISNVDYSPVVISQMKERYNEDFYRKLRNRFKRETKSRKYSETKESRLPRREKNRTNHSVNVESKSTSKGDIPLDAEESRIIEMTFECADVTKELPYSDSSFDLIIIKGTLDSVLCSNGALNGVKCMMDECSRVLDREHGVMFVVTHGTPENRLAYFENEDSLWWSKTIVHSVPKPRIDSRLEEHDKSK